MADRRVGWELEMKWQNPDGTKEGYYVNLKYSGVPAGRPAGRENNSRLVIPGRWFEDEQAGATGARVNMTIHGQHPIPIRTKTRIQ